MGREVQAWINSVNGDGAGEEKQEEREMGGIE